MSGNSLVRRVAKRALAPLLGERAYGMIQVASVARDIRSGALVEPEVRIALASLRPGDVAVDLGANYGMYAVPMARHLGPSGTVYAFEPIPFTVATLRGVCRVFRTANVDIRPKACGDTAGLTRFTVPVQSSGAISAGQAHDARRDDSRPGREQHVRLHDFREIECEVVALDTELEEVAEVSLIKADIEGMELSAFRGSRRIIERDQPIVICEINPWFLDGFGLTTDAMIDFFSGFGYEMYRWDEDSGHLEPVSSPDDVVEDNYVFVPPRRAERLADLIINR